MVNGHIPNSKDATKEETANEDIINQFAILYNVNPASLTSEVRNLIISEAGTSKLLTKREAEERTPPFMSRMRNGKSALGTPPEKIYGESTLGKLYGSERNMLDAIRSLDTGEFDPDKAKTFGGGVYRDVSTVSTLKNEESGNRELYIIPGAGYNPVSMRSILRSEGSPQFERDRQELGIGDDVSKEDAINRIVSEKYTETIETPGRPTLPASPIENLEEPYKGLNLQQLQKHYIDGTLDRFKIAQTLEKRKGRSNYRTPEDWVELWNKQVTSEETRQYRSDQAPFFRELEAEAKFNPKVSKEQYLNVFRTISQMERPEYPDESNVVNLGTFTRRSQPSPIINIPLDIRRAWGADEETPQIGWGTTGIPGYEAYNLFRTPTAPPLTEEERLIKLIRESKETEEDVDTTDPRAFINTLGTDTGKDITYVHADEAGSLSGVPSFKYNIDPDAIDGWGNILSKEQNLIKELQNILTKNTGVSTQQAVSNNLAGDGTFPVNQISYTGDSTRGGVDTMTMADFIRDVESQTRAGRQAQFERYRDLGGFNRFLNPQAQDVMRYQQFGPLSSQYLLSAAPTGAGGYAGFQNVGAGEAAFPEYLGGLAPTFTAGLGYGDAPVGAAGFGVPTGGTGAYSPWSRDQWQSRIGALYGGDPAGGMPGVGTAAANFLSVLSEPEVADIIRSTMMAGVNPIMQRYAPGAIRSMINRYRAGAPEVAPAEMLRQFAAGGYTGLPTTV